jgi:hypothetical protein
MTDALDRLRAANRLERGEVNCPSGHILKGPSPDSSPRNTDVVVFDSPGRLAAIDGSRLSGRNEERSNWP